jgi:hypothetical protein
VEAILHVNMEQLQEIRAGKSALKVKYVPPTPELKADMCAIGTGQKALKSEVVTITTELKS